MSKNLTTTIFINVSQSNKKYWIKLHRNNKYISFNHMASKKKSSHKIQPDVNGWKLVTSSNREKNQQELIEDPIYYWVVIDHNLFDSSDTSLKLFFTDPDTTQIENNDQNNYMSIDQNKQLRLIHIHLKHKGMKMTPTYYIARHLHQIEDALQFVKYCVIKTENNEQKFIELVNC